MLTDILALRLLAEFEAPGPPIRFDPVQVGTVSRLIRRSQPDEPYSFASPKGRWDFLEAARRYLAALRDREDLLVAFGTQGGPTRNARSRLATLWRSVGDEGRVPVVPALRSMLTRVAESANEEALIVHNHPPYWLRGLFADAGLWRPTASSQDRELAFEFQLQGLRAWFSAAKCGRLRWFLVDEDDIAEFRLPSPSRLISLLNPSRRSAS